ncbi:MAG: acyl carrier protein [Clostridiaceae bacterium]|jgi:acyl carrier protein|nr:acyl carrier protein [Eubacteriales bacterium]NLV48003.1 acyl carrier protein [Clostridiaceae bacterium]
MTSKHSESVGQIVREALASVIGTPEKKLTGEAQLILDLGMDSLALYEFVIELEEHFELQISDEDIDRIHTVDDIINEIERRLEAGKT